MSSRSDYQFVSVDREALEADLVSAYEKITDVSVRDSGPERLFIKWVASIIINERVLINYAANQNIPARAEGDHLDALGELFYAKERPQATPASCTVEFYISEAQQEAILVPRGTRVTNKDSSVYFETTKDAYVQIGETSVQIPVQCMTPGEAGNGYEPGEINTVVDVYDYYSGCKNITASGGGSDAATDDEFYELLRSSQDAYSVAGPYGAYVYHAKRASTNIKDVLPASPVPGEVHLYVLMDNGEIADEETKRKVLEACNDATVRPLTDKVSVDDPEVSNYDIDVKYYISRQTSTPAAEVQAAVEEAVNEFVLWQAAALGRDINPSRLIQMMVSAGAKRVEVTSPVFTRLHDGTDDPKEVPQIAKLGSKTVTNGGYEDD